MTFSSEILVANQLRNYLIEENWWIFQLISPGGQAHFSFSFNIQEKRKTIFPDLIAYKDSLVLFGEIKPKFDEKDKEKLLEIDNSDEAKNVLRKVLARRLNGLSTTFQIVPVLIHGDDNAEKHPLIDQIVISESVRYLRKG